MHSFQARKGICLIQLVVLVINVVNLSIETERITQVLILLLLNASNKAICPAE